MTLGYAAVVACEDYCQFMEGLRDFKDMNEQITIGNGNTIVATKLGDLNCEVTQINGFKFEVPLKDVNYVPKLWVSLFRINKTFKNRFKLNNDGILIHLAKGTVSICFDHITPTANSFVTGVKMNTIHPETTCNAMVNATIKKFRY
jgi:hypothetical protein